MDTTYEPTTQLSNLKARIAVLLELIPQFNFEKEDETIALYQKVIDAFGPLPHGDPLISAYRSFNEWFSENACGTIIDCENK